MAKTVVGSFDSYGEAQQVVQALHQIGIAADDISIVARDRDQVGTQMSDARSTGNAAASGAGKGAAAGGVLGGAAGLVAGLAGLAIPGIGPVIAAGPIAAALTGAGIGAVAGGLIGGLTSQGVSEEDAGYYAEAVRRGGALVTVRASDDVAERAAEIMERHNAHDVENRAEMWRKSGWTGFDPTARPLADDEVGQEGEQVLPVVEEELKVGKREVERGGVRVYTHVSEEPVEQQVTLREEHAHVERRPANRPATTADLQAFQEGSIEVRERREEAVVSKEARVVEEVVVGKHTTERTETIRDRVRRTDVEVDQRDGSLDSTRQYEEAYRNHFTSSYGKSSATFEDYLPAYRYGHGLSTDQQYRRGEWASIEPNAMRGWERENPSRPWSAVKDAVRNGWERASDSVERVIPGDSDRDGR
jgi:uncharacterized protein (TIGR02271 family)